MNYYFMLNNYSTKKNSKYSDFDFALTYQNISLQLALCKNKYFSVYKIETLVWLM